MSKKRRPYKPFPEKFEKQLWTGVDIECNKACNAGLLPKWMLLELKHEIYCHIKGHWSFDPSRATVKTYIANFTRWRIKAWRKKTAIDAQHVILCGDIDGEALGGVSDERCGYGIDDVIENAGFTEVEKKIMDMKLEGDGNVTIAAKTGLTAGEVRRILAEIRAKIEAFASDGSG